MNGSESGRLLTENRMPSPDRVIVALICGSIRKLPDFLAIVNRVLDLRDEALVDEIVFSTWSEELEADKARAAWIEANGIRVVTNSFKEFTATHNMKSLPNYLLSGLIQDTQLSAGLDCIRMTYFDLPESNVVIWKLRTDLMIPRMEIFTPTLRRLAGDADARVDRTCIHHASSLDFFDIADITYLTTLEQAARIGGLLPSRLPYYAGKHIPTEAIMCGNHYNFSNMAFFHYNSLRYQDRKAVREAMAKCVSNGEGNEAFAELMALHLHILTRNYVMPRASTWSGPLEVEHLIVGGEVPGMRVYREINHVITDGVVLNRFGSGDVTASTPFGRQVLSRMEAWRAAGDTFDSRRIGAALAPGLCAAIHECIGTPATSSPLARTLPGAPPPSQREARQPSRVARMLRLLAVPSEHGISEAELAAIAEQNPRESTDLAAATLKILGRGIANGPPEPQTTALLSRLRFWANLFCSMELAGVVKPAMAAMDNGYVPAIDHERSSQLRWLDEAGLSFAKLPG